MSVRDGLDNEPDSACTYGRRALTVAPSGSHAPTHPSEEIQVPAFSTNTVALREFGCGISAPALAGATRRTVARESEMLLRGAMRRVAFSKSRWPSLDRQRSTPRGDPRNALRSLLRAPRPLAAAPALEARALKAVWAEVVAGCNPAAAVARLPAPPPCEPNSRAVGVAPAVVDRPSPTRHPTHQTAPLHAGPAGTRPACIDLLDSNHCLIDAPRDRPYYGQQRRVQKGRRHPTRTDTTQRRIARPASARRERFRSSLDTGNWA